MSQSGDQGRRGRICLSVTVVLVECDAGLKNDERWGEWRMKNHRVRQHKLGLRGRLLDNGGKLCKLRTQYLSTVDVESRLFFGILHLHTS